jgi:hypothetical protein
VRIWWLLWCLALAASLAFGLGADLWVRLGLTVAVLWLTRFGWIALQRPGQRLRRLSWGSDGRWQAQDASGRLHHVGLTRPPQHFGSLLWLHLGCESWTETVLIDGWYTEPVVLAALKARLKLDPPVYGKLKS